MSSEVIYLESLNSNDEHGILIEWLCKDRDYVDKGDIVAVIETTKTVQEIESPSAGYCAHMVHEGDTVAIGNGIATILENPKHELEILSNDNMIDSEKKWTKKAEITALKLGVDIEHVWTKLRRTILESDILSTKNNDDYLFDIVDSVYPSARQERVLILGGGAGGGTIAIDAISRIKHQRAAIILDNNTDIHGKTLLGVPIIGSNNILKELWESKKFDSAIVAVTKQLDERAYLFDYIVSCGIPVANIIDPTVQFRSNVQIGVGNLIMANCYISSCVTIGNNNFFASHVCIEHHNTIGNNCTFGPRCTTAGAVTIGNNVKLGMNVCVEPYLSIKNNSLIASGLTVTEHVPKNTVFKSKIVYSKHKC